VLTLGVFVGVWRYRETTHSVKPPEFLGALEVLTTPQAEVLIDGRLAGKADSQGRIKIDTSRLGMHASNYVSSAIKQRSAPRLLVSARLLPSPPS
jgi:hypothetical protein